MNNYTGHIYIHNSIKMTTERTRLVGNGEGYCNNLLEVSYVENNPIKQLWKEILSGRQSLYVVLYSIFVAFGSCITGFVLGFSSLLNINMRKYHFPIPGLLESQFVGVSNIYIIVQRVIYYIYIYYII